MYSTYSFFHTIYTYSVLLTGYIDYMPRIIQGVVNSFTCTVSAAECIKFSEEKDVLVKST